MSVHRLFLAQCSQNRQTKIELDPPSLKIILHIMSMTLNCSIGMLELGVKPTGVCIVQCASLSVFLLNLVIIVHYQCNNNWPLVAGIIISENQLDSHTDKTFLIASF